MFSGLSLDSFTPHQYDESEAMTIAQRVKQYAEIPVQLERATRGIAALVTIAGLVALLALAISFVALERTSHAH